jgi:type IV fimbrial biogenesis protein FimT
VLDHPQGRHVRLNLALSHGFSLVELLIGIGIASILMLVAMPNYTDWMTNTEIRTGAQSIADGLRVAQTFAVKRNSRVQFRLDPVGGPPFTGWSVLDFDNPTPPILQQNYFRSGADRMTLTTTPAAARFVTFNGFGRANPANPDLSVPIDLMNVTGAPVTATTHPLRVITSANPLTGAGIRMCDPALPASDAKAC